MNLASRLIRAVGAPRIEPWGRPGHQKRTLDEGGNPWPLGAKSAPIGPHHPLRIGVADQSGLDAAIETTAGCGAGNTVQLGRQETVFASGIEARRAETPQGGLVYESPARGDSPRERHHFYGRTAPCTPEEK